MKSAPPHRSTLWMAVCGCLLAFPLIQAEPIKGPVKVFLLSGQSNMTGRGTLAYTDRTGKPLPAEKQKSTLLGFVNRPENKSKYAFLRSGPKTTEAGWTIRDDVFITMGEWPHLKPGDDGYDPSRKHGGLAPDYGGRKSRGFGPELAIGHRLGDHYDQAVVLVKVSFGGNSLGGDFRPPSSGGTLGHRYLMILKAVTDAITHLPEIVPGYTEGQGYELAGFFWNQGLNDLNKQQSVEYESNLVNLIKDLRRDLKAPSLKTVVAVTGNWGWPKDNRYKTHLEEYADNKNIPREEFMNGRGAEFIHSLAAIQHSQMAVSKRPEFKGTVATAETRDFWRPRKEFGGHGTWSHWNANGESYWLIGEAMGQAMLDLLNAATADHGKTSK